MILSLPNIIVCTGGSQTVLNFIPLVDSHIIVNPSVFVRLFQNILGVLVLFETQGYIFL